MTTKFDAERFKDLISQGNNTVDDNLISKFTTEFYQKQEAILQELKTCCVCGDERPSTSNPTTRDEVTNLINYGWSIIENKPEFKGDSLSPNNFATTWNYYQDVGWLCPESECHEIAARYIK